jgi:hypothetical protein
MDIFAGWAEEQGAVLREREQRIRRRHPDLTEVREAAVNQLRCPRCRSTINAVTGDGFHSPPGEPWAMICDLCGCRVEPDT